MRHYCFHSVRIACLALLLATTLSAVPLMAAEGAPSKGEAASLMKQGRFAAAYDLYMRLLRETPDDDEVNLNLARSAMRSARYNQAVMAYERLVEKHPSQALFYEELAHAYMALNDRPSAERVLAAKNALDPTAGKADGGNILDALEKRYDNWQVHGKVRSGIVYDSNANFGPSSSEMELGDWRVHVPDAGAKATLGAYLGAQIDLAWKAERDTSWWLVGDAQGQARANTNQELEDNHSRTSEWGRAAVGIRHLTPTTLFDLRVKGEVFDYEWYQNVAAVGPEVTWLWAVSPAWQLISRGSLNARMYSRDHERNGAYWSLGQYVRRFFGQDNHEVMLGLSYNAAGTPKRDDYCYHGWEVSARALFKLPKGFELAPFAAYANDWYNGPATVLETSNRQDQKWRLGAALTWRITEAWSVETMYQYTHNRSNSAIYEYDQSLVSLGAAWSF